MKKIRVMFVVLQLDAGGSERVVYDLAQHLDKERFEVYVVAFKGGVLTEPLKTICKEVIFVDKKQRVDLRAMLRLAGLIRRFHIDVVNAHHYMPCFYSFLGACVLSHRRLVFTEHSVPEVESVAGSFHRKVFNAMLYRISAVVGVSKAITDKLREWYPNHGDKFQEILNGVDIERFRSKEMRGSVRASWSLGPEHFVVGTVANFRTVKNHACLVRAAARLKDSHPALRLVFVGTGFPGDEENSEPKVRELVRDLGMTDRVFFAGYQEDIPTMLSGFDAFCLPSFSEGLPLSILEAMAARVPVIGSEAEGIREVIVPLKTGWLFPVDSVNGLSRNLIEVMNNKVLVREVVASAWSFLCETHNKQTFIKSYSELYL